MYKSAESWQIIWPSFEGQPIEKLEKALEALSLQLGIEPKSENGATLYSQYVAQFLDKVLEEAKRND